MTFMSFKLKAGVWGPYLCVARRAPAPQGPRGGSVFWRLSKGEGDQARPSNVRAPEGQWFWLLGCLAEPTWMASPNSASALGVLGQGTVLLAQGTVLLAQDTVRTSVHQS